MANTASIPQSSGTPINFGQILLIIAVLVSGYLAVSYFTAKTAVEATAPLAETIAQAVSDVEPLVGDDGTVIDVRMSAQQIAELAEVAGAGFLTTAYGIMQFGDDIPDDFMPDFAFEGMRQMQIFSASGNALYLCKVPPLAGDTAPCNMILMLMQQLRILCIHPSEVAYYNWVMSEILKCCPNMRAEMNAPLN